MSAASGSTGGAGKNPAGGPTGRAVVCSAAFLSVLTASIMNVVLPVIGERLSVGAGRLGWVITGYLAVFGVAVPFYGRLADLYGARRFFICDYTHEKRKPGGSVPENSVAYPARDAWAKKYGWGRPRNLLVECSAAPNETSGDK